jgi:translocation and assembly module TamB
MQGVNWKRIILRGAAILGAVIVLALIGGYLYLRSGSFKRFAMRKVVEQIDQSTGGRAEIGNLDFKLSTLTARADHIVIHGKESPAEPPLLAVDRLIVGLKIQSILRRKVYLSELLVEHPVVDVRVDSQGNSNLPQPKEPPNSSGSRTNLFALGVRHAAISRGEISYNDRKIPLDADLHDLHTDISFESLARRYRGSIAYRTGVLRYANDEPLTHSLEAVFTATPTEFDLSSATMQVASSSVTLKASLANYAAPVVNGTYDIQFHAQDARKFDPSLDVSGEVGLAGKFHYQLNDDQPFIRSVTLDGGIASEVIFAKASGDRIELRKLRGQFQLADGSLRANDIVADAYNGHISAEANLANLDTTIRGQAKVHVDNLSLLALQHSLSQMRGERVAASGNLDGNAEATWTATPVNALVRADLSIKNGGAARTGNPAIVPVDGVIHAIYDGQTGVLSLRQSTLRIPSATIAADGQVSNRSSLRIHAGVEDLHDAVEFASSFRTPSSPLPPIAGAASIDATITGSTSQPAISGMFQAHNLEVQGSQWKSIVLSVRANSNHLTVADGNLVAMDSGRATFSADVALHHWAYQPSSPMEANLTASQMRIADLQQAAGVHYPMSGNISAKISVRGSQIDPHGSGSIEITNARAGDEPFKTVKVTFQAQNGSIASQMQVVSDAGTTNARLEYTPKTKAYKLNVDAPQIVIQKLHTAQGKNLAINGNVTLHASGQGTLDDPALNASIVIPKLDVKGKSVAGVKAQLQVANKRADFALDSEISQASLKARGRVDLTGNYETEASVDSSVIPLGVLLATYANGAPEGFSGQAELHASLKGPLKNRNQLQAHLEIPKLEARYQSLEVGLAQPLRADFANSVISLEPAEIRGTGTSIRVQGRVPLSGSSTATLTAQGAIDAKILRLFAPDVRSSGTINLDVRATGSASEPQLGGEVRLQDIAVATPDSPLSIDKLNGVLKLDNEKIRISEMSAQVGGGQVSLGGTFGYRGAKDFDLALKASSLRLRYPEGLRSMLDANLIWTGDMDGSTLRGTVLVDGISFTPDFDLASFGDQFGGGATVPAAPGFADTVNLQVRVQSKDNLSATSSQVSLEGSAALNVGGAAADPVITGRTDLTSGELFYRNVRYQLQRGIITFSDPNETRPNLDVSVTTTIEQYNLTLNLRGPLDTLTTSYSSDPPLATADIINLIARGKTSSELAASSQSTDSMIASQAASQVSGSVQKLVGISSLTIDPTLGGNSQNPSARVAVQQRVTKNFLFTFSTDVTQPGDEIVQGDYQINKRWSVSVARDQLGGVSVDGRYHTKF